MRPPGLLKKAVLSPSFVFLSILMLFLLLGSSLAQESDPMDFKDLYRKVMLENEGGREELARSLSITQYFSQMEDLGLYFGGAEKVVAAGAEAGFVLDSVTPADLGGILRVGSGLETLNKALGDFGLILSFVSYSEDVAAGRDYASLKLTKNFSLWAAGRGLLGEMFGRVSLGLAFIDYSIQHTADYAIETYDEGWWPAYQTYFTTGDGKLSSDRWADLLEKGPEPYRKHMGSFFENAELNKVFSPYFTEKGMVSTPKALNLEMRKSMRERFEARFFDKQLASRMRVVFENRNREARLKAARQARSLDRKIRAELVRLSKAGRFRLVAKDSVTNKPVAGVSVKAILGQKHISVGSTTNEEGVAELVVPSFTAGMIDVSADGYKPEVRVFALSGRPQTGTVFLEPDGLGVSIEGPSTVKIGQRATFTARLEGESKDPLTFVWDELTPFEKNTGDDPSRSYSLDNDLLSQASASKTLSRDDNGATVIQLEVQAKANGTEVARAVKKVKVEGVGLVLSLKTTEEITPGMKVRFLAKPIGGQPNYVYEWLGANWDSKHVSEPFKGGAKLSTAAPENPKTETIKVKCRVKDGSGAVSDWAYASFRMKAAPLQVQVTPREYRPKPGSQFETQANVSGGVGPFDYDWLINGERAGATSQSHVWKLSNPGTYNIVVKVTDKGASPSTTAEGTSTVLVEAFRVKFTPIVTEVEPGEKAKFNAGAVGGTGPFTYTFYVGENDPEPYVLRDREAKVGFAITATKVGRRPVKVRIVDANGDQAWAHSSFLVTEDSKRSSEPVAAKPQPEPRDSRLSSYQRLGRVWHEAENGHNGVWTRRGNSNVFDATWDNGAVAVLTMTLTGNVVKIQRHDPSGVSAGISVHYSGTISKDGRTVSGKEWHPGGTNTWSATIVR